MPSVPISTPTSTLPSILYITSSVKVRSSVIGPWSAQTVFPATGAPFVTKGESGHVPVRTVLDAPPVPPVPVGSDKGPASPGDAIEELPPPHANRIKVDNKIPNDFKLLNIKFSS